MAESFDRPTSLSRPPASRRSIDLHPRASASATDATFDVIGLIILNFYLHCWVVYAGGWKLDTSTTCILKIGRQVSCLSI